MKTAITIVCAPALLPDFEVWRKQKEQCESCHHLVREGPSMVCMHHDAAGPGHGRGGYGGDTCINQREKAHGCGPEAKFWKAKAP